MQIVVTGGAGFIGCHLAERLVKLKHKVIILDNLSTGRKKNIESITRPLGPVFFSLFFFRNC